MFIERSEENPILKPSVERSWEANAVFNGCPVKRGAVAYLLYRALSFPHYHTMAQMTLAVSDIGIAQSKDGINFSNRRRFITPTLEWDRYGCEDPRVTKLGDTYYIFYTALSSYPPTPEGIKIGVATSKDLETVEQKHLVTPFNAKAMALFPEKIGEKFCAALTVNTDKPPAKICLAFFDREEDMWSKTYWDAWYKNLEKHVLPLQRTLQDQVELGAPPLKTPHGWLVFYSYIRNYFSSQRLFGIEAVLLDLADPSKIIGQTKAPLLTPEEYYERMGMVPNVIFPSGALQEKNSIRLYYGAADTTCCVARIDSRILFEKLLRGNEPPKMLRLAKLPIISPIPEHPWEAKATFNPASLYLDGKVHLLYRAMSQDNTSVLGYASSDDGARITNRLENPAYVPREDFEQKKNPGGNSGCEDPRATKIGETIYMLYTAFDGKNPPRVALTSIQEQDFLNKKWDWTKPILLSPPDVSDKDACIFPEKFAGKYFIVHRVGDSIDFAYRSGLKDDHSFLEEYRWISPRKGMWDDKKVGVAAPPLKTKAGWLLFYHGISQEDQIYRVGALLLDLKDPTKIIGRSDEPLLEPEALYEKRGVTPNVVFPCGAVVIKDTVFLYYGGGDKVVGVATILLKKILAYLKTCKC